MATSDLSSFNARQFSGWQVDLREGRLRKVARLLLREKPGRMLDIGCSDGVFTSPLIPAGWEITGTEISLAAARAARERGLRVVQADVARPLPFADARFDLVWAGEIIEHLIDTDLFIAECRRVLRPGGKLLLTTPNLASFENRARILFGRYPIWVDYRLGPDLPGHVRAYTPRELKKQLRQHGFAIEIQTGNFVPIVPQQIRNDIQWPWLQKLGDWFPNLAMDIIVLARKSDAGK
jgi:SAM-dependent methyltransferase